MITRPSKVTVPDVGVKKHSAGSGGQKPANNSQSGGLATAGGAKQREKFVIVKIEIDTIKYPLPVELHSKILESDEFFGHYPPPFLFSNCQ